MAPTSGGTFNLSRTPGAQSIAFGLVKLTGINIERAVGAVDRAPLFGLRNRLGFLSRRLASRGLLAFHQRLKRAVGLGFRGVLPRRL